MRATNATGVRTVLTEKTVPSFYVTDMPDGSIAITEASGFSNQLRLSREQADLLATHLSHRVTNDGFGRVRGSNGETNRVDRQHVIFYREDLNAEDFSAVESFLDVLTHVDIETFRHAITCGHHCLQRHAERDKTVFVHSSSLLGELVVGASDPSKEGHAKETAFGDCRMDRDCAKARPETDGSMP